MMIKTNFLLLLLLFSVSVYPQGEFEGYIICIDNYNEIDLTSYNKYYFLPLNYEGIKDNNVNYNNRKKDKSKLEYKLEKSNGLMFYSEVSSNKCQNENYIKEKYLESYLRFIYFHYNDDLHKINDDYFLKKIKRNNYYVAKIEFLGCELYDDDYLDVKIKKMYIDKVIDINKLNEVESKKIINFIKCKG